jgi:hypothetical protein
VISDDRLALGTTSTHVDGSWWIRVEGLGWVVVGRELRICWWLVRLERVFIRGSVSTDGHWKTKYFEPESFWTSDSLSPGYLELELMFEQERLSGRVRSELP